MPCMRCLPQVFACYLFPTINLSLLYRDFMMTEFEFFANREERWGDSMRALWGSLNICPLLDHVDFPYHMAGELLSISCLKVWGDTQQPHNSMAYLLVRVEDASKAEGYSMALVWISPHQARASMMEEASGLLSTCMSPVDLTGHMSLPSYMRVPIMHPSLRTSTLVSCPRERQRAHVGRSASLKSASSYLPDHESSTQWV